MNCIGELTNAQKTWILWKKLNELQNLLQEIYVKEFRYEEARDRLLTNTEEMPF